MTERRGERSSAGHAHHKAVGCQPPQGDPR
jgi:hypothetical protein